MKTHIKNLFLLPVLIAGLGLIPAGRVSAQTFTTLRSFATNAGQWYLLFSDGTTPVAGLILSGNTLYGTTRDGGSSSNGTVFGVNTDGSGFTTLHDFTATNDGTNSEGVSPAASLILSGNALYGTAVYGGSLGYGTVFAVNTNGTGFTNLHSFNGDSDGYGPQAGLILSGNTLYGTARSGGTFFQYGTVFAVNTDGTGFTTLHSFTGSDGASPRAGLILSGNTLYGTTKFGGSSDSGTVFALNTNGSDFTTLHSFTASVYGINSDGYGPLAGLVLSGNTLYGTAAGGGSAGRGTVFAVNTDGSGFTNVHVFTANHPPFSPTNSDGTTPVGGLILSGTTLYGTASGGGLGLDVELGGPGNGTVFAVNTDGTGFTNLHSFTRVNDGANPSAGLILSGNTLYGTAVRGGSSGFGTVFSLSLPPPQLEIMRSGTTVILTWPSNAAGFTLQSAPAMTGTFTNLPGATNPFTNPITGAQKYFRLISN